MRRKHLAAVPTRSGFVLTGPGKSSTRFGFRRTDFPETLNRNRLKASKSCCSRRAEYASAVSTATDECALRQSVEYRGRSHSAGLAGGKVVAPAFKDWHKTFWDNLDATIQLHNIKKMIAINHRDCGAAKIAYGDAAVATKEAETETHRKALAEFRKEVNEKQPKLGVETGLMAINGKFERLG